MVILGNSLITKESVVSEFFTLFPATIELAFCATIFAIFIGLPAGIIAAVKRGTVFDHSVMTVSLTGYSMPIFWWALLLMLIFSVNLGWTPVSGRIDVVYWIDHVTGFMLIDTFVVKLKWVHFARPPHHLYFTQHCLRHHPYGCYSPYDTLFYA